MQKMIGAEFADLQQMQCHRELALRQEIERLRAALEYMRVHAQEHEMKIRAAKALTIIQPSIPEWK